MQQHPKTSSNKALWKDSFSLLIVIGIGIVGFFYVLKDCQKEEESSLTSLNYFSEGNKDSNTQQTKSDFHPKNNQLKITGEFEAGEYLQFTIDGYDEFASYELNLGNGKKILMANKHYRFIYPKSGMYTISLQISFNGESRIIHEENIQIAKAMEVAKNALIEVAL